MGQIESEEGTEIYIEKAMGKGEEVSSRFPLFGENDMKAHH